MNRHQLGAKRVLWHACRCNSDLGHARSGRLARQEKVASVPEVEAYYKKQNNVAG